MNLIQMTRAATRFPRARPAPLPAWRGVLLAYIKSETYDQAINRINWPPLPNVSAQPPISGRNVLFVHPRLRRLPPTPYDNPVSSAVCIVALFGAGLFSWTFLEYAIHGWMGHRSAGIVHSVHRGHHRDPASVFAIGAWIPAALPLVLGICVGAAGWLFFYAGMLTGFAAYEVLHYRMHFSTPFCRTEARLRERHLIHHYCAPARCFGVTSSLWDSVFGTGTGAAETKIFAGRIVSIRPLRGRSNIAAPRAVMRRFVGALASR
jgi:hypothetical protein